MEYEIFEDIGKLKREKQGGINEDSVGVNVVEQSHRDAERAVGVFVVADGAGGYAGGEVASYIATTVILDELSDTIYQYVKGTSDQFDVKLTKERQSDPPEHQAIFGAIQNAINEAHREILRYAREAESEGLTTATVGVRFGSKLYYGWVGDSPAYLINRKKGTIELITQEHSKSELDRQEGKVDDIEAKVHLEGHMIARALGGGQFEKAEDASVKVDTDVRDLYADDVVLITSDGLVDAANTAERIKRLNSAYQNADDKEAVAEQIREEVVTDQDIREIILNADDLSTAAQNLIDHANESGGKDNISGILTEDPSHPATPSGTLYRGIDDGEIEELETQIEVEESSTDEDTAATAVDETESSVNEDEKSSSDDELSNTEDTPEPSDEVTEDDSTAGSTPRGVIGGAAKYFPGENSEAVVTPGTTVGRHDTKPGASVKLVDEFEMISPVHVEFDYTEDRGWIVRDRSLRGTLVKRGDDWQEIRSQQGQNQLRVSKDASIGGVTDTFELQDGDEIALVNEKIVRMTFETDH